MRREKKKMIMSLLVLLLLGLGIGYAFLTTDLGINGIANVPSSSWDIHFANIVVNSNSVEILEGNHAATIGSDPTTVSYNVTLKQPGDFYEFTVDAVNAGTIDGMIESVNSTLNGVAITNLPEYMEYSVTYGDDMPIRPNHLLEAGKTLTYKVRIGYKKDINASQLPSVNQPNELSLDIDVIQADENGFARPNQPIIDNYNRLEFRDDAYRNKIKTITLDDEINPPENVIESWNIGVSNSGTVMAYLTENATDSTMYDLYIQGDGKLYANPNSSYLFYDLKAVDAINNIEALDTSKVVRMDYMFLGTGKNSSVFTLDLGNNFDTSNVTSMRWMFENAGQNSSVFSLNLGDKFDTSKVTNMESMFYDIGYNSTNLNLNLGNKFDTSNVTEITGMFGYVGYNSTSVTINLGNKFNLSKATNLNRMFDHSGYNSTSYYLNLGNGFDTSYVEDMSQMFYYTAYSSQNVVINLGDKFDTSNVTNMNDMFYSVGSHSTSFTLDLGDKFDTSNVTTMYAMFQDTGAQNTTFKLRLGNKFNTENVTNMYQMFCGTGRLNPNFVLDLSSFDFSSVTANNSIFGGFSSTQKIYVKDQTTRDWIINNSGNNSLTTNNVLIKGA